MTYSFTALFFFLRDFATTFGRVWYRDVHLYALGIPSPRSCFFISCVSRFHCDRYLARLRTGLEYMAWVFKSRIEVLFLVI